MTTNLFADLPSNFPNELFTTLLEASNRCIERIVSHGQASPEGFWYDQDKSEWLMILKGTARLGIEDQIVDMKRRDIINIPAHQRHRVEWTTPDEPTIWLALYYED